MTEDQLLTDYVRVRRTLQRIVIEVLQVEPSSDEGFFQRWSMVAALPLNATPLAVGRVRLMSLSDYRHFRVCDECDERFPAGLVLKGEDEVDRCRQCQDTK